MILFSNFWLRSCVLIPLFFCYNSIGMRFPLHFAATNLCLGTTEAYKVILSPTNNRGICKARKEIIPYQPEFFHTQKNTNIVLLVLLVFDSKWDNNTNTTTYLTFCNIFVVTFGKKCYTYTLHICGNTCKMNWYPIFKHWLYIGI